MISENTVLELIKQDIAIIQQDIKNKKMYNANKRLADLHYALNLRTKELENDIPLHMPNPR